MPSRRRVLAGVAGLAGAVAGVGCTELRDEGGPGAVCSASFGPGGDEVFALVPHVRSFGAAGAEPGVVELVVPVRTATAEALSLDLVLVRSGGRTLYRMPVSPDDEAAGETARYEFDDVVEYQQALGHVPQTGRYDLVALDDAGERVGEVRMDVRCYRRPEEGAGGDGD
jgi:hypothetical protein